MAAPTFIDDNIDVHTGVDGLVSIGAISPGEVALGVVSFMGNDNVVLSAQESPWEVMQHLVAVFDDGVNPPFVVADYYFLRGIATEVWSPSLDTTGSTSDFGSADGYGGGLYIAAFVPGEGTESGADSGLYQSGPDNFLTENVETAMEAHAMTLHCWTDDPASGQTITWGSPPGGEGASRLCGQQLQVGASALFGVECVTYSTAGDKTGLELTASGYGSTTSAAAGWMGFESAALPDVRGGHWQ